MTSEIKSQDEELEKQVPHDSKKPNEAGALHVEGFIRIYDPETKEVFVEARE